MVRFGYLLFTLLILSSLFYANEAQEIIAFENEAENNSLLHSGESFLLPNSEKLRKELIKVTILGRLGLNEKPNVDLSKQVSRDIVIKTLKRTTGSSNLSSFLENSNIPLNLHPSPPTPPLQSSTEKIRGNNFAQTSEIISFPDKGPIYNGETLLSFSFAGTEAYGIGVRVKKAYLWIKLKLKSSLSLQFSHVLHPKGISLYVFQVAGNFTNHLNHHNNITLSNNDVNLELVGSRTLSIDSLGWQKLDITPTVAKWYSKLARHRIRHPHSNHAKAKTKLFLLVDCARCASSVIISQSPLKILNKTSSSGNGLNFGFGGTKSGGGGKAESGEIPFLVLEIESVGGGGVKRNRRRALECSPRVKECCKERFFISFQDLGWDDWIIAPKGYYANYCRGSCGGPYRSPSSFLNYHSHILEEYKRTAAGQLELASLTPCCSPTKFSSISLIYFGPDLNIIKRDLPKMVVEECGCP